MNSKKRWIESCSRKMREDFSNKYKSALKLVPWCEDIRTSVSTVGSRLHDCRLTL